MFAEQTRNAICALVAIDTGVTSAEREMLVHILSGKVMKQVGIVKYADAAKRLNLSVPSIKKMVANGKLKAVSTGGPRSCGVTEESLINFCNN